MDTKEIHTGLYSEKAFKFLEHMLASQLRFRKCGQIRAQFAAINIERAPDNEVILTQDPDNRYYYGNSIWRKPNNEALKWLAIYIKEFTRNSVEIHEDGKDGDDSKEITWARDNTREKVKLVIDTSSYSVCDKDIFKGKKSSSLNVKVGDIYFIYDKFMSRKDLDKKYDTDMIDSYVGQPSDPITTEMEIAKRQDIKALKDKLEQDLNSLDREEGEKQDELRVEWRKKAAAVEAEYSAKCKALRAKHDADMATLVKSYDMSSSSEEAAA